MVATATAARVKGADATIWTNRMVGLGDRGHAPGRLALHGAPVSDSESIAALREALDCGVNFIDTELTPKWSGHTLRG
jgi:hypothetical protein